MKKIPGTPDPRWFGEAVKASIPEYATTSVIPRMGPLVVLHLNTDFSSAIEAEGVYPEFSPDQARALGMLLIEAADVAEQLDREVSE